MKIKLLSSRFSWTMDLYVSFPFGISELLSYDPQEHLLHQSQSVPSPLPWDSLRSLAWAGAMDERVEVAP